MTLAEKLKQDIENYGITHYMGITIKKGPFPNTLTISEDEDSPLLVTTDPETTFRNFCYERIWKLNKLTQILNKEYVPEVLDG